MPPLQAPRPGSGAATPAHHLNQSGVLYFAYGANMAGSVLARRGVAPLASEPAIVADADTWLAFAHRGGYATLLPGHRPAAPLAPGTAAPSARLAGALEWRRPHGVLHTLRCAADLERLGQRETGYRLAQIEVHTYGGGAARAAAFLSSPLLRLYSAVPPRRRYRELLLDGCRQHGLDAEYAAWLQALPVADDGLPLPPGYDACPAEALARLLAGGALGAAAWASLQL